ncbi:MAG TPA: heme-binding protein [Polyangiaceae bacterium]|nr:heme-binding protein [Polyangiaceae bacterium]
MLTSHQASAIIAAGEARASALGVRVNIAVLDAGAHLKAFSRMDGAVLGSIDVALKKAATAALFETTSEAVWEYCKPGAPAHALEHTNRGLAPFAGGLPLRGDQGELLGAIGVSGGAVSEDLEIAVAAIAALSPPGRRT